MAMAPRDPDSGDTFVDDLLNSVVTPQPEKPKEGEDDDFVEQMLNRASGFSAEAGEAERVAEEERDPNTVTLPLSQLNKGTKVLPTLRLDLDPQPQLEPELRESVYDAAQFSREIVDTMLKQERSERAPEDYAAGRKMMAEMVRGSGVGDATRTYINALEGSKTGSIFHQGIRDEYQAWNNKNMGIAFGGLTAAASLAIPGVAAGAAGAGLTAGRLSVAGVGLFAKSWPGQLAIKASPYLLAGKYLDKIDEHTTRRAIWETIAGTFNAVSHAFGGDKTEESFGREMAKNTFFGHALDLGYPWWATLGVSVPALAADWKTSTLYLSGVGLGVKTMAGAGGKGSRFQTLASRIGQSAPKIEGAMPAVKSRLGVYYRNPLTWKRDIYGLPFTEKTVTFLRNNAATIKFFSKFIPESVPRGPHMRIVDEAMGVPANAEVYASLNSGGGQVVSLTPFADMLNKMAPSRRTAIQAGSEWVGPARRGGKEARDVLDDIFKDNPKDLKHAETWRDMWDSASTEAEKKTSLRYDQLHGGLKARISKNLNEQKQVIAGLNKKLGKDERLVVGTEKKLTAAERLLGSLTDQEAAGEKKVVSILQKRFDATRQELDRQRANLATPIYQAVEALKGAGKALQKKSDTLFLSDRLGKLKLSAVKAKQAKAVEEAASRIDLLADPSDLVKSLETVGGLKPGKDVSSAMYEHYKRITTGALKKRAEVQVKVDELYENSSKLESAIQTLNTSTKPEILSKVSKALTLGEYRDVALVHRNLSEITKSKASAARRINGIRGWLAGHGTSKSVEKSMKQFQNLNDEAAKLDDAFLNRIDRTPRLPPEPGKLPLTPTARSGSKAGGTLELGSAAHERTLLDQYGRSESLYAMEKKARAAINNPDVAEYSQIKTRIMNAYGTESWEQAQKAAMNDIKADKNFWIVSKMVLTDAPDMIEKEFRRVASDAGIYEMAKGLKMFASDIPDKAHQVPAAQLGKLVGKLHPGKFFPQQIKEQIDAWSNLANQAQTNPGAVGRFIKGFNAWWKFGATGARPSFHFRNAPDDLMRFATEGAYDPIALGINGTLAMAHGRSLGTLGAVAFKAGEKALGLVGKKIPTHVNVGKLGRRSYKDLFYLMDGYNLFDSGVAAEAIAGIRGNVGRFSAFSWGENMRRAGLFIERLKQDMSPLAAAISVKKVAYPTTHITRWEKGFRDTFMPFYGWSRYNIPHMAKQLFKNPAWSKISYMLQANARRAMAGGEEEGETPFDMMPDYIRDMAIMTEREPGATKVLQFPGMSFTELSGFVDDLGNPKEALNELTRGANRNLAPFYKMAYDMVGSISGLNKKFTSTRVVAPIEFEKIPDSMRPALGLRYDIITRGGDSYKQLTMPSWVGAAFSYIGYYNDFRKALRPDSLKKGTDSFDFAKKLLTNRDSTLAFFTGITWNKISDTDLALRTMREIEDEFEGYASKKGWMGPNGLLPEYQATEFGAIYGDLKKRVTDIANHKYNLDYMARIGIRETPKDESEEPGEAETVQPVQP